MHEDLRRAVPRTYEHDPDQDCAATASRLVLPELNGKLDGYADPRADHQRLQSSICPSSPRAQPRSKKSMRS